MSTPLRQGAVAAAAAPDAPTAPEKEGVPTEGGRSARHKQVAKTVVPDRRTKRSKAMKNEGIEGTERFGSPDKGRGLRAVGHFAVGELVFACPAYAYVLTVNERGAHCEHCFTR